MKVLFTVDVEEQGLFSGSYERHPEVDNVLHLDRLERITTEFGIPLTLLCTYPVVTDDACRRELRRIQDETGAELGVHLHPWTTPPFDDQGPTPLDSSTIPTDCLAAKLDTLTQAVQELSGRKPTSFRMGRFDFSNAVRDMLVPAGFTVDSSAIPLQPTPAGTDYFLAPTAPYMLDTAFGPIYEVPPTMAQAIPGTARPFRALAGLFPQEKLPGLLKLYHYNCRVGLQPLAYGLSQMKAATWLHERAGGDVLTFFLHSSELSPGHHPRLMTQAASDAYLDRIHHYLAWLDKRCDITGATLSDLG